MDELSSGFDSIVHIDGHAQCVHGRHGGRLKQYRIIIKYITKETRVMMLGATELGLLENLAL
jgi:hypothetical protein